MRMRLAWGVLSVPLPEQKMYGFGIKQCPFSVPLWTLLAKLEQKCGNENKVRW